jgi:hypothetical protein
MTCPFTQTYAADAASPTCQAFWVQSIWAPHVAHGSDRRSVFSTTVTRLPKLHEREQRVCRRDAFLYCRCIFVCSVASMFPSGGPVDAAARHRAVGTGPELSFAGLRTSERSTGAGALQSVGLSRHPHSV